MLHLPGGAFLHQQTATVLLHYWSQPPHKISYQSIGGWLTVIFRNSRWRPSAILDFRKPDFWPMGRLELLIFHHGTKFSAKMLIDAKIMAHKRNSKWRPPQSWIYFRWLFLTYSWLSTVDLSHHTKFRANISIGGWLTVIFQNSRWRPSAILDFRKTFLTNGWPWVADFPSRYQIWCKNVDQHPTYGTKLKSKTAAVRRLGFVVCSYKPPTKPLW